MTKQPVVVEEKKTMITAKEEISALTAKAQKALTAFEDYNQEQVDHIVHEMALAALDQHMQLAKMAVEETGRGVYEDKCIKNMYAAENIWHVIKKDKTVGIIDNNEVDQIIKVADPVGVVAGIVPTTNPTSTTIFKAMICMKTRNPIIFSFHPSAEKCSVATAKVVYEAAIKAGAPKDCIQWVDGVSMEKTAELINHPEVAVVLATGGAAMVKAAYSTGKPALGVGPGNVPAYIEKSANVKRAVNDIIVSKTFDNGMICASEQAAIVDSEIYDEVKKEFQKHNVYFVKPEEMKQIEDVMMNEAKTGVRPNVVGMHARKIAELAGIKVPENTKMIIAELDGVGAEYPLSREKLSPVLAMMKSTSTEDGFDLCKKMLDLGGLGHSASIHTRRNDLIEKFGKEMKACRILVNSPSSQAGIGDLYNNNIPSLTLGCGSYGKNSVSHNVSSFDLLNVKTIAKRRNNMQWMKLPEKIFFEENSVRYLRDMRDIERVFIVADDGMVKLGYVDVVIEQLKQRSNKIAYTVFSDVEPNPTTNTVNRGTEKMRDFQPDTIIAIGGGSPMDAAKGMWLFYEHPESNFFGAKQKYLDVRKRAYKIDHMKKAKMICIPTTSGTGSEVTPFAVITDSETHIKYPLADYALTPDVAIVDPQFVYSVPKSVTADTGMDVLTHAIESYVSVLASDYTKGLSLQAIKLVFENLRNSYNYGDQESRQKMHNASTIAGMAFANAFLGISHSIAHKIGGQWDLIHGRTNAILLPHIVRYNAIDPQKHAMWAKYEYFRADEDYADIARMIGLKGNTTAELVEALAAAITKLGEDVGIKMNFREQGITKEVLDRDADKLAELAFEDQCTTANPKQPLISELKEIIYAAYEG
ncbi:alcohol dehydrogenase iron-type [Trichococcus palustris]|jgi:acetaldehyde dehydrogenase / alcohol dehydrogenase|uniref:Aldehyde-alcohol dehydrogenase n=1 Tax=Trichococcus palustris TaxID=140314 RepID=A0A143Y8Q4_9LACT|nr:bifunctional acetaldehyde-CoA/alcohol dehydrogenase [Trichococcus palustris]CZQ83033.1 alcohol dehydrogenase iron-type [Trichococcus palustris]SFK68786.1 acetaldehyde dehydrogenase / alcohol dehydrogenase [Trichococcus palustris]